jgi:hypothetical protein
VLASSNRRLSLDKRKETVAVFKLNELEAAYITHDRQRNSSRKTIERFQQAFGESHQFLTDIKQKSSNEV